MRRESPVFLLPDEVIGVQRQNVPYYDEIVVRCYLFFNDTLTKINLR